MDRRRSRGHMRPVILTGSTHDNPAPLPSTTANSDDDVYTIDYRSTIARDYKKTVTFRKGVLVHNEHAKDWDRDAPHPTYESSYSAEYRHERRRGSRSKASGSSENTNAAQGSLDFPLKDSLVPEQSHSKSPEKVASSTEVPPPQKLSPHSSTQPSITGSQEGCGVTLLNAQEVLKGKFNTSSDLDKQFGPPTTLTNLDSREHPLEDVELIARAPSSRYDDENIGPPTLDTQDRRHSHEVSIHAVQSHNTASISRQQEASVKIPLSFFQKALQATISAQALACIGVPRCNVLTIGSIERPMSLYIRPSEDSRSHNSLSDASSFSDSQSRCSSELSRSGRSDAESLDGSSVTSNSSTLPEEFTRVPPAGASHYLPCEFNGYRLCDEWFPVEDTHSWSEHVITDHLDNILPSMCSCWFCDDIVFDSEKSGIGCHANFMSRMEHIRGHFLEDGCAIDHIRIDCHFLNHIWKHGLITPKVYDAASKWMEGPSSGVSGFYAYDFEPLEVLQQRENLNRIKIDQQKENRYMFKQGRENIKFRRRGLNVKAIQGKMPFSVLDTDHTHEYHQLCKAIIIRGNSGLSYSNGVDESHRAHMWHSRSGGLDTPSATDTLPESRKYDMSAREVDVPPCKQDLLDELRTRFSQVAIADPSLTTDYSKDEKLDSGQGSNHQSNETLTDHLHAPTSSAILKFSQHTTPILIAPIGTSQDISSLARSSIELLGPKIAHSTEVTREHTASSNDQPNSSASSPSTGSQVIQPSPGPGGPVRPEKRKRRAKHPDEEESDEDLAPTSTKKGKGVEKRPPFACPYFKHDQIKYRNDRVCSGPGWPNIPRLKEHIYRHHQKAKHCRRCWATFAVDKELTNHLQQDLPCPRREEVPIEGLDDDQERALKTQETFKKTAEYPVPIEGLNGSASKQGEPREIKMTEYEKWRKIYKILFPTVDEDEIPAPYYDSVDSSASLISDAIARREAELCQNLPMTLVSLVMGIFRANNLAYDEKLLEDQCKLLLKEAICSRTVDGLQHTNETLGARIEDLLARTCHPPQTSTSGSVDDTSIHQFEFNDFFDWDQVPPSLLLNAQSSLSVLNGPVLEPRLGAIPGLYPSNSMMDHLRADTHNQPTTDVGEQSSDSGYGSGLYYNDQQQWLGRGKQ